MKIVYGNLFNNLDNYDYACFTANSTIKADGSLVMGAGSAKVVRDKFPGSDVQFGKLITHFSEFNLMHLPNTKIVALQTKIDWKEDSPLGVIENSINALRDYALKYPQVRLATVFPGINNGNRSEDELYDLINTLPDNVDVWKL